MDSSINTSAAPRAASPIKIAVLAMGGQGGGVADWIVDMAEHAGWWAQTTSVPGVAQRTGATIYYLELLPRPTSNAPAARRVGADAHAGRRGPGGGGRTDGGRAIQRGLVTPDRSVLITSSHRSYAVSEKSAPGNGIADPNKVLRRRQALHVLRPAGPTAPAASSAPACSARSPAAAPCPSRAMISKPPCAAPAWAWTPACAPSRWASTPPPRRPPACRVPCRPRRNRPPARASRCWT